MTGLRHPPRPLRVPGWDRIPNLVHGFYGRRGGVSRGAFAELNLSFYVGDRREAVEENWDRVAFEPGAGMHFTTMRQVHGAHVATVADAVADAGEADALVTRSAGVALSVLTADCVPILLVAPHPHMAAAVHAGWRGTVAGIAQRALQHIERAFGVPPEQIHAALGPAIGACCYEVERPIVDELEQRWGAMRDAVRRAPNGKATLDLRRANTAMLVAAGVPQRNIVTLGQCACCAAADYFSYRAVNGATGRQLSFIGWRR